MPPENIGQRGRRSARRKLRKTLRTVKSTDRSGLTAADKARLDDQAARISRIEAQLNPLRKRVEKVEAEQKETKRTSDDAAAKVEALAKRLEEKGLL